MSTSFSRGWSPHSQSQVQSFQYPAIPRHAFCRETPDVAVSEAAQRARELAMQQELAAAVETALKSQDVHRLKEANAKLDEGTQHLATLLIDRAMTEARTRSKASS